MAALPGLTHQNLGIRGVAASSTRRPASPIMSVAEEQAAITAARQRTRDKQYGSAALWRQCMRERRGMASCVMCVASATK